MQTYTPDQAWQLLDERLVPLPACTAASTEAVGRVLAAPLRATVDMPPADVSAMDGYAVAGEVPAGTAVEVLATVTAGRMPAVELAPSTAVKIMTGAVVPRGADRVIPVEESDGGDRRVVFTTAGEAGRHIRRCAEVTARGDVVLDAGSVLTPGAVSLAASHGYTELPVVSAPTVAVLVTGDELVPPDAEPGPGQLRDSNSAFLRAATRSLSIEARFLGIARDREEELRALVERGLEAEVLLVSGGVSMGELDLVEGVLQGLGCERLFDAVAIQPGKPLVAAVHAGGWVFGLPGNPASVMVTFWLFVRPLLRRLMGLADGFWQGALAGILEGPLPGAKDRDRFLPAAVRLGGAHPGVVPLAPRGSHDVASYGRGTALVRVRPRAAPAEAGEPCEILPLVNWMDRV